MASNGFNITPSINLDGVSDFKNQVKQVSSQIALINSDFKANAAEMKASGKTAEGLEKNLKNLEMVYDAENKKLDIYQKELENIVATQGENSKAAIDMQIKVNQQAAAVSKAKDNLNQYAKEMDDSANETKKFGDEADESGTKALKLGDIIKANLISDAIKAGLSSLVNGIKDVGAAFSNNIKEVAEYGDNIDKMSQKLGLSAQTYQKWDYVLSQSGVEIDSMQTGLKTLTNKIDDAKNGSEKATEMFKKLGISTADLNKMSREEVFEATIKSMQGMADSTERAALANDLFGKSGQELTPLFNESAESTQELMENFEKLGMGISQDGVDASVAFADSLDTVKRTIGGLKNNILSDFLPSVTGVMDGLTSFLSGNEEGLAQIEDSIEDLLNKGIEVVNKMLPKLLESGKKVISALIDGINKNAKGIMDSIMEILQYISKIIIDNLPIIINAGIQILTSLIQGIAEALPTLIPEIVEALILIVTTLLDNIDMIIDAGIQLIMGLADGLIEALPILIDKIPEIIDKLIMAITNNLPKIIEAGIILIIKLAEGLIKAIPQLVSKIPEIIGSMINGIKNYFSKMVSIGGELLGKVKEGITSGISKIFDVGKNLVKGLWDGINNAKDWVLDKIKGFGKGILDGIKGFFGIHSPSRVFRDQIGANLAKGLGLGFEDEMKDVTKDMTSSIPTDFDVAMNARVNKNGSVSGKNPYGTGTNIVQNITVNSPQPLNPTETAREIEKMSRELAWGL